MIGLVVPALIILFDAQGWQFRLFTTLALLTGYYAFRVLIFEAGVFDPIQSFVPQVTAARRRPI